MQKWINYFLLNRQIRVRLGDKESGSQETENGSTQAVVLSPTLVNVIMGTRSKQVQI